MIPQIPGWLIRTCCMFALIGAAATLVGAVWLVVYVARHISWN